MIKWIVSWRFNDINYTEGFESYVLAYSKLLQLEAFNQQATIHMV